MPKKGQRLYRCEQCGSKRAVHWVELNRASKPQCYKCGCTRLEIVSEEGKKERIKLDTNYIAHKDDDNVGHQ